MLRPETADLYDVEDILGLKVIGVIPESPEVLQSKEQLRPEQL